METRLTLRGESRKYDMAADIAVVSKNFVFPDYQNPPERLVEKFWGEIPDPDFISFQEKMENLGLKLLSFISPQDHTVFNQKQMLELMPEVEKLKLAAIINPEIIAAIERAIQEVLRGEDLFPSSMG